jgi:hypothetical protein
MTAFQDLQAGHEALLKRQAAPDDPAQFWTDVQSFIDRVRNDAQYISAPRERDQLRAILRFWASYVYDKTGSYPDTTLRPPDNPETTSPPPPPPPRRTPIVVWAIAALAVLAIVIAVIALRAQDGGVNPQPTTPTAALPERVATQAHEQIMVNAAMTEVVATISTPTDIPTPTATSTPIPPPTLTPVPSPTPTPTPVVVRPATRTSATPLPTQPLPEVVPLDVGYQVLTQGPSPFDTAVWVIQLRLVGIGVNGVYIYWVNGRQLPGDEYTVQGQRCEPQTLSIGVTSSGQAVKRDIALLSPLANCLRTRTP